jgi:hypothetical protein
MNVADVVVELEKNGFRKYGYIHFHEPPLLVYKNGEGYEFSINETDMTCNLGLYKQGEIGGWAGKRDLDDFSLPEMHSDLKEVIEEKRKRYMPT